MSLQDKAFLDEPRIPLRPVPHADAARAPDLPAPLIYLTLGTAFATAALLRTALAALAPLARVVAATGNVPPAAVNPLPATTSAHAWLPQTAVISHAALVVHHGGSGTMLAALAAGVPQLLLPQGADQFANAAALTAAGACLTLPPPDQTADAITTHARTLLTDPAFRDNARALAGTIAAMPSPRTWPGGCRTTPREPTSPS
ncbi:glycosyltransferase [Actinokineospora soli]|uniref:Glycosyltransferase n=1 Tax=Actinokineospora soli TaxID=1048753 RepID=A0ABW2TTY8_9PSEU